MESDELKAMLRANPHLAARNPGAVAELFTKPPCEPEKPKTAKYKNKKTTVDGIIFASQKESVRYRALKVLQKAGAISDLELQPKYVFELNGVRIASYKPDFRYQENGRLVVEDVKSSGTKTQAYRLRKRMMLAFHGINVRET
jgi:hypothetical protein